jgi:transcriptional regulator with PAS, ATPase and Fis domain
VLAETVHKRSPRATRPFVAINCAALSESILESELFGHEKGAFTGALQAKVGLLEAASGGSLFLDEVGEMPLGMQAKLLRVLESRQVLRVGATKPVPIDVRFIAATNRDLEEEVASKAFRQDLYFRLNGICLEIPPLRERTDEIEPILTLCLQNVARQLGRRPPEISAEARDLLMSYGWPGNIRELRNVIERAALLCPGDLITPEHLPANKMRRAAEEIAGAGAPPPGAEVRSDEAPRQLQLKDQKEAMERQALMEALARCAGSQTRAAELLGISRRTLCSRLKQYDIPRPRA